jgi:hypothetical protein
MSRSRILNPDESYTFSKYAELPFDASDILKELGVTLKTVSLQLPHNLPIDSAPLRLELQENLTLVSPASEIARRESLIFPVLKTVCRTLNVPLRIEYPVRVSNWLKGTFDYLVAAPHNFIVIEAKNADLARGFIQLSAELIALDQWIDSEVPVLYGAVTTGDTWKFGRFHRCDRQIDQDINTYAIPSDLDRVLSFLFGIGLAEP